MITQTISGGWERRTSNCGLEPSRRQWAAWALMQEGAGRAKGAAEGNDGPDKDKSRFPNILIVDDDESFGSMLEKAIVRLTGYNCSYARDANAAMQILEETVVDVVITDIKMPGMNGLELTRHIKDKYQADIIVITGYQEDFFYEYAIEHGASDFIEKPIRPTELVSRLKRVLRERENFAQRRQAEEKLQEMNSQLERRVVERHAALLRINALLLAEIHERQQAEEELCASKNRYRLATDAAHEGIWDMDLINNMVRWNKTFSDQFGDLPDTRLSWQWWLDRIHPEDSDRTIAGFTGALKGTSAAWNQEYRFLRPDGTYAQVINRAHIERDSAGKAIKIYGAMLDITPLRQVETALKKQALQLEQANKELESFSYSISHDLREPLRAIHGFSRMLLKDWQDKDDEAIRHKIAVIQTKAEQMGQLIENVLTFSRLGRQSLTLNSLDLEKLATEVWNELREHSPQRNVIIEISAMTPCRGDYNMIRQVLANLLSNALKFTKDKETATIEVGGYAIAEEHVYYVKDNGVGFDMRFADKLFKIFQRLHSQEEYEGIGVGLSFVKRIIERHGGRIWAEGKINKGATFYFTLPNPGQRDK